MRFDHDELWLCQIKGHMLGLLLKHCLRNQQLSNPQLRPIRSLYRLQTRSANTDHIRFTGGIEGKRRGGGETRVGGRLGRGALLVPDNHRKDYKNLISSVSEEPLE